MTSDGPFNVQDEPAPKRRGLLADRERRNGILVCVALFAFRDFGGTRAFTKTVRHTFGELNTGGPVSYDQCALVVTALQVRNRLQPRYQHRGC